MHTLAKWHHTRSGLFVSAAAELAIAYGFASLAIDQGNLLWYLLFLILLVGAIKNTLQLLGRLLNVN